jgi:hypothetical protein
MFANSGDFEMFRQLTVGIDHCKALFHGVAADENRNIEIIQPSDGVKCRCYFNRIIDLDDGQTYYPPAEILDPVA